MRPLALCSTLVLLACGSDTSPGDSATESARSIAPIQVNLVSDDPAVRQRLSPPQLLAYVPARIGTREPRPGSVRLDDEGEATGWASVTARYSNNGSSTVQVVVTDLIDDPVTRDYQISFVAEAKHMDTNETGEIGDLQTFDGGMARTYTMEGGETFLYVMLADRFTITLGGDRNDASVTTDALWEMYQASDLPSLAGAPVYAEAETPEVHEWAAVAVSEWEAQAPSEGDPVVEAPAPAVAALPACDTVLPLAEVERVCRVSGLRLVPNPFSDEGATGCNRKYAVPGNMSGLVFIVSRYSDTRTSLAAQGVTSDFDSPLDLRSVPGLGDAATRFVQELPEARMSTRVLSVAANTDLIEFKSTVMPDESGAEVCTLDQMETLARGVVERLRD